MKPVRAGSSLIQRLVQLYIGLVLYGVAIALQVRANLGLDPWDVLHQGLSERTGIRFGTVVILVGVVVLLAWIPLRQRPGVGTVSNVVVVGLAADLGLAVIPYDPSLILRIAELVGGIVLLAMATGMYIGAHLGPGPRDGLMTGFAKRTGRSIRLVRTGLEVSVLIVGWLLGGTVGIGTVVFALSIGPLTQVFLRVFELTPRGRDESERRRADGHNRRESARLRRELVVGRPRPWPRSQAW